MAPKHKHDAIVAANLDTTRKLISSTISTSKSLFFKTLPVEVRDIIFDHLWSDTQVIIQHFKNRRYTITYDNRHDSSESPRGNGKARWLLTNRQMMREGVRQLHQKSTWHFDDRQPARGFRYYVFDPITPPQVHTHEILLQGPHPLGFSGPRRNYSLTSQGLWVVGRSVAAANISTPLDTVCIKIFRPVREPHSANMATDFTINLSGLERLSAHASLRRFQVHLFCGMDDAFKLNTRWGFRRRAYLVVRARSLEDHYLDVWQEEVTRVGRLLVQGGKKTGYMKEATRESNGERHLEWVWIFEKP